MGAMIALLLVLGTLTACAGGTIVDVKNALPAMAAIPDVITYTVEVEDHGGVIRDTDGVQLVTYYYEVPVLRAFRGDGTEVQEARSPAEEKALTAAETFNSRFSDWLAEDRLQDLTDYAAEDRAWREESGTVWDDGMAYTESLTYEVYETEHLVSIAASCDSFTGGAHPNQVLLSWNFDLTSGEFFAPEALAADGQEISDLVSREISSQARRRAAENGVEPETMFWENYEEIAADWGSYAVSFDEAGMTVGYSPYEMACYAAGAQRFTLSYDQLLGGLSDHGKEILELTDTAP
ncbi:DUF3298 domain-containing protein [Dysosmobacter sp.]